MAKPAPAGQPAAVPGSWAAAMPSFAGVLPSEGRWEGGASAPPPGGSAQRHAGAQGASAADWGRLLLLSGTSVPQTSLVLWPPHLTTWGGGD